jgi:hypothetical protein
MPSSDHLERSIRYVLFYYTMNVASIEWNMDNEGNYSFHFEMLVLDGSSWTSRVFFLQSAVYQDRLYSSDEERHESGVLSLGTSGTGLR